MSNVAPWTHTEYGDVADPLNFVFVDTDALSVEAVVVASEDWGPPNWGSDQYLYSGSSRSVQAVSLSTKHFFDPEFLWFCRYHLRLWNLSKSDAILVSATDARQFDVVGGAHLERVPVHTVVSFERGEKKLAEMFSTVDGWQITHDGVQLGNMLRSPHNNGFATLISRSRAIA